MGAENEVFEYKIGKHLLMLRIWAEPIQLDGKPVMLPRTGIVGFNIIEGIGGRRMPDTQTIHIARYGFGPILSSQCTELWTDKRFQWDREAPNDTFCISRPIEQIDY